jgi:hypothetical protein
MDNKTDEPDSDDLDGDDEQADGGGVENVADEDVPDFPSAQPRTNVAEESDGTWTKVTHRAQKRHGSSAVGDDISAKRVAHGSVDNEGKHVRSNVVHPADNNELTNGDPKYTERSASKSSVLTRSTSRVYAHPQQRISFADAVGNNQVSNGKQQTLKQVESDKSAVEIPTRMDTHSDVARNGREASAANAKTTYDNYHWRNTNYVNNARNDVINADTSDINSNIRERADGLLAQTTVLLTRLLRVVHNEDVVDRFFEPEKSTADASEYIAYFDGLFRDGLDELTTNVRTKTRNLQVGTQQEQTELLTELVLMKNKIQNILVRIRAESASPFAGNQKYDKSVAYKQLTDYDVVSANQNRIFHQMSNALAGVHYAKLLDDIQRKIAEVRATLPNHRVLFATVAQQSVKNSRSKLDKLFRRLRPDLSVGRQQTTQQQSNMQTDAPSTQMDQEQQLDMRRDGSSRREKAESNVATVSNNHIGIISDSAKDNIRTDLQTTKPKLPYAQVRNTNQTQSRKPDARMNNNNASLLGRPPQRHDNSTSAQNRTSRPGEWPASGRSTNNYNQYNEQRAYYAQHTTNATRNHGCARFDANGYNQGSWTRRNNPASAYQHQFPDWIAQSWYRNGQCVYTRRRHGPIAEDASNLHPRRGQIQHRAHTGYVGPGSSAGRW